MGREDSMKAVEFRCCCGHTFSAEVEVGATEECPRCGRPVKSVPDGKTLTQKALDATFEVMSNEGAIWSGAR